MSISHRAADQIHFLSDLISGETDPIRRLVLANDIYQQAKKELGKQLQASAYNARSSYAAADISDMTGIEAGNIVYYARKHAERENLPLPRRQRIVLDNIIDLSRD